MSLLIKIKKVMWAIVKSRYRARLFIFRCAPSIEHVVTLTGLSPRTILDIGANVGQFSAVARELYPDAHIHAFEPLPKPFGRLQAVFAGDTQVTLRQLALGASNTPMSMHVSARDDNSSLLPIGERQRVENPGTHENAMETIQLKRLDEVLEVEQISLPVLAKIDVQGYELQVLDGMGLLLPRIRWILCEVSFVELYEGQPLAHEIIHYLAGQGFYLRSLATATHGKSGQIIQADLLFERCNVEIAR